MRRITFVLTVMAVFLLPLLATAENNPWERKLPFESATITYQLSGSQTGTETMTIRKYGKETATYHKSTNTMMGRSVPTETLNIRTPDYVYTFDLIRKTGKKEVNPQKYMIEEYNKLSPADKEKVMQNAKDMGTNMAQGYGGKVERSSEKILGYDCDRVTMMGTTVSSIHETGIPLKMHTGLMGVAMDKVATDVKQGSVDSKLFDFPAGITPQTDPESDAMARSMAQQTIAMLKDPEGARKAGGYNPMLQQKGKRGPTADDQGVSDEDMEKAMQIMKQMRNK